MNNKIIDKIQKLIKLSGSNEQGEAETAMKMAQELAIKYDIDISQIDMTEKQMVQEFVKESCTLGQRMPIAQKFINPILMKYFGVHLVTGGNRAFGRVLYFIGRKDKAEFAKWINEYLNNTFMNLWRNYQIKNYAHTKFRDSYLLGLREGLMDKLEENKKKVEQENVADHNRYAIVIQNEKEQLKIATQNFFSKLGKAPARKMNPIQANILNDGYIAGKQINIHAGALN